MMFIMGVSSRRAHLGKLAFACAAYGGKINTWGAYGDLPLQRENDQP